MLIKHPAQVPAFVANDGCLIRELLHPAHGDCDLAYSLALAEVAVGAASYRHRLAQTEVYFIVAGEGELHIDARSARLTAGDTALIPAGAEQWIENCGNEVLQFLALVSPPWCAAADQRT
ncbi:MAG: cupin domain-containing protein [Gammaproteobacteria bacterium]|nr:cupin domain-containing protein [Gammaproteobacteria bacterium]